jgi:hypothetical protein
MCPRPVYRPARPIRQMDPTSTCGGRANLVAHRCALRLTESLPSAAYAWRRSRRKCEHAHTGASLGRAKSNIKSAQATLQTTECSMSDERWPHFAAIASIILAIFVAYLVERKCQRELAFQRSFPSALSELIVGSEPIRCWFSN